MINEAPKKICSNCTHFPKTEVFYEKDWEGVYHQRSIESIKYRIVSKGLTCACNAIVWTFLQAELAKKSTKLLSIKTPLQSNQQSFEILTECGDFKQYGDGMSPSTSSSSDNYEPRLNWDEQ